MAITTVEQFKQKAYKEVEISGFEPNDTCTVLLRRTSIMKLMSSGKIPNSLLGKAQELFGLSNKKVTEKEAEKMMGGQDIGKLSGVIDILCEATLVEPKWEEVSEFLTDEQKMDIFEYSQNGIISLEKFRDESGDTGRTGDVEAVQDVTE